MALRTLRSGVRVPLAAPKKAMSNLFEFNSCKFDFFLEDKYGEFLEYIKHLAFIKLFCPNFGVQYKHVEIC